ncbi:MAG TPA: ATP-binding protein [Anaerolineales bacterium]|nr:ATP-binding protein [Anaerolineales bacterium]
MTDNPWKTKWTKDEIKAMFLEQFEAFWQLKPGIERTQLAEVERAIPLPHAVIISGLRRVGKSTLLAQLAHRLGQDQFYYVNFEDDRLIGFQAEDTNDLYQVMVELFGERKIFVLDEVQNIPGWEHFVRQFMDMGFKFYITGSNASLLSRELGTRLTGRYVPIELFPFSFQEFMQFRQIPAPTPGRMTTVETARLQQALSEYLQTGGIPDPLKYPELPLLRTLYEDVLYRDIATRHRIEEVRALKELAFYLMSNPTASVSFNKLKEQFRLGSVNTIKNYIEYLENSWLIFTLNVYDYSVKRQQIAAKKIYPIDTGLANAVGFSFSPNTGKLLETAVFLALRRQAKELYYFTTPAGYEIDFYLPETRQLIQVTQHLNNPTTREREVRALLDAMPALQITESLILTEANADPIQENGMIIHIKSVAEWLFER